MIELGDGFAFIGNQYKLEMAGETFWVDLLFFHRKLNCLVAVELKTGKFKSEYISKMNMYLEIMDDTIKQSHENPAIGIILCAEKNNIIVEYALRNAPRPIGVAEYELEKKLKEKLPTIDDLKKEITNNELNIKR